MYWDLVHRSRTELAGAGALLLGASAAVLVAPATAFAVSGYALALAALTLGVWRLQGAWSARPGDPRTPWWVLQGGLFALIGLTGLTDPSVAPASLIATGALWALVSGFLPLQRDWLVRGPPETGSLAFALLAVAGAGAMLSQAVAVWRVLLSATALAGLIGGPLLLWQAWRAGHPSAPRGWPDQDIVQDQPSWGPDGWSRTVHRVGPAGSAWHYVRVRMIR